MNRLLALLLLGPLTAAAAEWRYGVEPAGAGTQPSASTVMTAEAAAPARDLGNVPVNNMTMSAVRRAFGEPDKELPAVGEPPITRWQYPGYVVYFENEQVITTVAGRL